MKKLPCSLLIALCILSAGCTRIATDPPKTSAESKPEPYEIGSVRIVSDAIEYEPHEHFLSAAVYTDTGMVMGDGKVFSLEDISGQLSNIPYADDFQIEIDGEDAESTQYALYNERYESVYPLSAEFSPPTEAGTYLLCIDVKWSNKNKEADPGRMEYTQIRYSFKIINEL